MGLRTLKGWQSRFCFYLTLLEYISRYLTELGKKQAEGTGQRLGLLYSKYLQKVDENGNEMKNSNIRLVKSTMTRATETANIILKQLPELEQASCDLLREGAPCIPDPPIGQISSHSEIFFT